VRRERWAAALTAPRHTTPTPFRSVGCVYPAREPRCWTPWARWRARPAATAARRTRSSGGLRGGQSCAGRRSGAAFRCRRRPRLPGPVTGRPPSGPCSPWPAGALAGGCWWRWPRRTGFMLSAATIFAEDTVRAWRGPARRTGSRSARSRIATRAARRCPAHGGSGRRAARIGDVQAAARELGIGRPAEPVSSRLRRGVPGFLAAREDACLRSCVPGHRRGRPAADHDRRNVLTHPATRVGRWIQLGGHCEARGPPRGRGGAAEAEEESGIDGLPGASRCTWTCTRSLLAGRAHRAPSTCASWPGPRRGATERTARNRCDIVCAGGRWTVTHPKSTPSRSWSPGCKLVCAPDDPAITTSGGIRPNSEKWSSNSRVPTAEIKYDQGRRVPSARSAAQNRN